ncbi:hypothetical protein LPJ64_004224 [Coemansia asiatica]|uniref:Uncharacterized protein n=1 Tax=Coemansia asiatica TaxID=1052880 RepID=A0A9W8CHH5_9FUNG|nr:hypothetical protein LPJ64_004224 [Coemansia asiatica]
MHGLLVPSLDNRASMQSSRSSGQLSKQSRPSMFKHRRDSSLSTSASISSDHTRVLPFATAAFASHRLQPISIKGIPETPVAEEEPNSLCSSPPRIRIGGQAKSLENGDLYYPASGHPRFALAQPRRVVTVNGPAAMPAAAKTLLLSDVEPKATGMGSRPQCARTKRRSVAIGISSMLPSGTAAAVNNSSSVSSGAGGLSGARPRPIIGLGLTLNPADTLVTLQMRCRRNAQPRAVTDPQTAVAEFIKSTKDRRENQSIAVKSTGKKDERAAELSKDAAGAQTPESSGSSESNDLLFDLALLSPQDIMKSCVSLAASPRNLDPELISIARRTRSSQIQVPGTPEAAEEREEREEEKEDKEEKDDQIVPLSLKDAEQEAMCDDDDDDDNEQRRRSMRFLHKPLGPEPTELTCLLCFERVLVPRKRTIAMRCPSCLASLI